MYGKEHVGEIDEDEIQVMFQTNVLGLISLTQLFVKGEPGFPANLFPADSAYCPLCHRPLLIYLWRTEFKQRNSGQ